MMGQLTRNEVFTLAVQKYSDAVYRAAMHNSRCAADAEDVVQDVYEKLLHYNGTFESEEHLKAWLLRVAINRCRDLTRAAHQKDTELDENLPAPDVLAEDGSVLDAIRTLPENYRNADRWHCGSFPAGRALRPAHCRPQTHRARAGSRPARCPSDGLRGSDPGSG